MARERTGPCLLSVSLWFRAAQGHLREVPLLPCSRCLEGAPTPPSLSAHPQILGKAPTWGKFLAAWTHGEALGGSILADTKPEHHVPRPSGQTASSSKPESRVIKEGPTRVFAGWPKGSRGTQNQNEFCLIAKPTSSRVVWPELSLEGLLQPQRLSHYQETLGRSLPPLGLSLLIHQSR